MTGNEIYNLLTREICEGRLCGRLPSIARMTAMYGTSHSTVQLVMDKLKKLDEVAYVRFASVYREFKDVNTFMDELKTLLDHEI